MYSTNSSTSIGSRVISMTIEELIKRVSTYMSEEDVSFIEQAYEYAKEAHDGQYRKSGEEYISHPIEVAGILLELQMDVVTLAAALLHDVVEDTDVTVDELKEKF